MTSNIQNPSNPNRPNLFRDMLSRAGQIFAVFILQGAILFLAAGRLDWLWAWVLLGIYLVTVAVNSAFLIRVNPELIAERSHVNQTRGWDIIISGLWALVQYLILPVTAGLDVRFGWTQGLGPEWNILGAVVFTLGLALLSWAMITNAFFSTAVRIQTDRGQTVCRSGPYRFVRHPGYAGVILQSIGIAPLLGSWWSLIPAAATAVLIILRTVLEDRTLQAELPGYPAYVQEVRHRLIPGIW